MATNGEILDTAPLWWEIQNIPTEAVRELRRRNNTNNIGMNIPTPFINTTFDFEKNYKNYKGPMTPWARVFSNSTGKSINGMVPRSAYLDKNYVQKDYNGFILKGGDGFFNAFGYEQDKPLNQKIAVIGYEADGTPHYIDNKYRTQTNFETKRNIDFPQNNQVSPIIPPPGLVSVSVKQSKELLTYSSFKFKCYGVAQLEYLTPFFLTAGINVFIEFGWNLFNQKSLIDLNNLKECWDLVNKPQTALDRANKSNGNYGCVSGIITKYSFNTNDGFVYDCNVDVISRQGMFAGMRTDNNAKIATTTPATASDQNNVEFLDLRTFIRTYLPSINDVMRESQTISANVNNSQANFLNYIIDKINMIPKNKVTKDALANEEQLAKSKQNVQTVVTTKLAGSNTTLFYGGKPEDRVFAGRLEEFYRAKKKPDGKSDVIDYGTVKPNNQSYTQLSFVDDKTDFDSKDGSTEVWMQLDFVFELVNLFMANSNTNQFLVDISDIIISGHPNLISCDKNVLIPNPVSPKINRGSPYKKNSPNSGFLKNDNQDPSNNSFLRQLQDITVPKNDQLERLYKKAVEEGTLTEFYRNLTPENSFYFAANAAKKAFKTSGRYRDNIDSVINYLYYHSVNSNRNYSASFPFAEDTILTRTNNFGQSINVKYKKYYYGYLKNLYISKTKLIEIVQSSDTKNYKQFINAILNTLNEAVDNFWKFDIVEGKDKNDKSTLSIIDKNTSNFDELREVYMFELGRTNNVIRSINFDVSLTNEQAINVMFGGQNSTNLRTKLTDQITTSQTKDKLNATLNDLNNIPFLKFVDRMDKYQLGLLATQQSGSIVSADTLVPGASSGIEDDNNAIADLQSYGSKEKSGVLCITTKQVSSNYISALKNLSTSSATGIGRAAAAAQGGINANQKAQDFEDLIDDNINLKNHKFLCLPSDMKGKLTQMMNDDDYKNNGAKYSGVADNFTVTIKFDGIFSFRNLQVFAISNLPKPYVPGNIIFQILEVDHEISGGKWETTVSALVRCIGSSKLEYITV